MMDRLEEQLRDALRRQDPPRGFAARIEERIAHRRSFWVSLWPQMRWAVAVLLVVAVLGGAALIQRQRERRRAEGEAARRQVLLALHIAGSKVRLAQTMVQQINEKSVGREQ